MNHNQALLTPPVETGTTPDTSNSIADAYGPAEEMGLDPMNDMQLGPEDGLVRGSDGQLHAVDASSNEVDARPRQIAVHDLGAGATKVAVSRPEAGTVYQGKPVQAHATLHGGVLVGEKGYQGTHRPR